MPKTNVCKTDYSKLKPLFFAGASLTEIAREAGIGYWGLAKYSKRYKWDEELEQAKQTASKIVQMRKRFSTNSVGTPIS